MTNETIPSYQKRILSVQDISCLGKCSNTVAMPVLSAAGHECVMLPTALLSTHTAGFQGFTFLDLTEEMEKILAHYVTMGLRFDAVMTGYFGSKPQIALLLSKLEELKTANRENSALRKYIDPVLGDGGKLYSIYDTDFVQAMRELCLGADLLTPNITEACLLTGETYTGEAYDEALLERMAAAFREMGVRRGVITGVRTGEDEIAGWGFDFTGEGESRFLAVAPYVQGSFHGTGDLFTATIVSALEKDCPFRRSAEIAAKFTADSLRGVATSGKLYGPMYEDGLRAFGASL